MNNRRYSIHGEMVRDTEGSPVSEIDIRELLDGGSAQFAFSKLSAQQKLDVIQAFGKGDLSEVLGECYRQHGRTADPVLEAEIAIAALKHKLYVLEYQSQPDAGWLYGSGDQSVEAFRRKHWEWERSLYYCAESSREILLAPYFDEGWWEGAVYDGRNMSAEFMEPWNPSNELELKVEHGKVTVLIPGYYDDMPSQIEQLRNINGGWQIDRLQYFCGFCKSIGHVDPSCTYCHGAGFALGY